MKDYYTLKNIKKVKWGVLEENQPISLYPIMYPGWCGIIKGTGRILGKIQRSIICVHQKLHGFIFINHKEWTVLGQYALKKILKNSSWGYNLNKKILKYADELIDFTHHQIFKVNLKTKTKNQLYKLYKEYDTRHSRLYNQAIVPVYLDLYKPHLTFYLTEYLHQQVKKVKYSKTAKECFALLTVPEKLSKVQLAEKDLLNLAFKIKKSLRGRLFSKKSVSKDSGKKINQHIEKFRYQGYNFEGPAFHDSYFEKRLKEMIEDKISPAIKLKEIIKEKKQAQKIHQQLIKDLKIDYQHHKLLEITQGFIYSKDYRKMSLVQSYYELEPLLKEIGRRLKLSLPEIRNCLLTEIKLMTEGNLAKPKDLNKRMKGCLFVVIDRKLPGKVLVDSRYVEMRKYLLKKEDLTQVNYFHGQAACLGKAEGTVKIINTIKDLPKMKKGNIMISQMTNPDLVPAMKKAKAIVTDLGGVTCHAAIVSRELRIPCVIGTKIATKVLRDGDRVVVDANQGDVKKT